MTAVGADAVQLVLGLAIVGLPVALVLAWAFEWTPEGLRTESPRPLRGPRPCA